MSEFLPVGFGVLSWRGYESLAAALESYAAADLFSLFAENVLFLPEAQPEGSALARRYGLKEISTPDNLGILGGFKALAQAMASPILLLAENDYPLIEPREEAARQLRIAADYLARGEAHVWRFRHRLRPGQGLDRLKSERYWPREGASAGRRLSAALLRILRPGKAARLSGWTALTHENAERLFPGEIRRTPEGDALVHSRSLPWCNNVFMVRRDFFLKTVIPAAEFDVRGRLVNGFPSIETEINRRYWRRGDFWTGVGRGLFTHARREYRGY